MPNRMGKEEVLKSLADRNVQFIRLQFTDILGTIKNVAIPVEQAEMALDGNIMFDGSSIEGFVRIEESDMRLLPDPGTLAVFPWTNEDGPTARLICDILTPNGDPFEGCPRGILKKTIAAAGEMGCEMYAGPEPEFFLFLKDKEGNPTVNTQDQAGYFDLSPIDRGEEARRDMVLALQAMGFEIEASHHEVAPGQHEIDFRYTDALTTADYISTFRLVVRTVAMQHNLHATFMPKPIFGINGSGMHVHQSLIANGKNVFDNPSARYGLSDECLFYIGGLLKHAPGFTAICNPLVNSYKRLVPGYEAPVYIAWSERNRSPLVRVPASRGMAARVELRSPDPSCNPYLALAVTLMAGLDGIRNRMELPAPINKNIYAMSAAEREAMGIRSLPGNLFEAIRELKKDMVMRETLGEHILNRFVEAKTIEWDTYRTQVHDWEINQYLGVF